MGWATVVNKSDLVFALMELRAWWQEKNIKMYYKLFSMVL